MTDASFKGLLQKASLNVEVVHLTYYSKPRQADIEDRFEEESLLMLLYKFGWFPRLREIVVPKHPVDFDNKIINSGEKKWAENRRILKSNELIKSGKIKLREIESGENGK